MDIYSLLELFEHRRDLCHEIEKASRDGEYRPCSVKAEIIERRNGLPSALAIYIEFEPRIEQPLIEEATAHHLNDISERATGGGCWALLRSPITNVLKADRYGIDAFEVTNAPDFGDCDEVEIRGKFILTEMQSAEKEVRHFSHELL